jgi:uncharacterized protein YbcI
MNHKKPFIRACKSVQFFLYFCIAISLCLGMAVSASAVTGDDLAKEADKLIRNAERNMFNRNIVEAAKMLEEASTTIDALKAADPEHKKLKTLEGNYAKAKAQVDKKLGQDAKSAEAPLVAPVSAKKSGGDKLPGGVKKRLQDIAGYLNSAERYASSDAQNAKHKLQQAEELFAEIKKMYSGQFDETNPEFTAVRNRYNSLMGKADAQGTAEAKAKAGAQASKELTEKQSAEWVAKFRTYLSYTGQEGHDPTKVVFVPGTSEPGKFAEAQKRYDEFKAFYAAYKKVEFPYGKTWELEDLADNEAPRRLAHFETSFSDRKASVSGDAEKQIDDAMKQLEKDNGWKRDENVKPPLVDSKWMVTITESVGRVTSALGDDPKAKAIRDKYAALVARDQENRKIRAERTLLFPDVYKGSDAGELRKKAELIVGKEKPGSKVLRVSLYNDNWTEETVEEWTDTTKTQRRVRTTRKINAQVAAKDSSGVFMHTLHIAKDKQSGGWSQLYGHIMWSDPMVESNVRKVGKKM